MDIAQEQLFRELEETSLSDDERDMLLTAKRYSFKLKTGMITDIQMIELITAMTKVGGKLEFAEIPNSSIVHERARQMKKRQIEIQNNSQSSSSQSTTKTAQTTSQQNMEHDDDQTVIIEIQTQIKDEVVETYIDSFGKERPLDEWRDLIDQEEDLKDLLESLRSPPASQQQKEEIETENQNLQQASSEDNSEDVEDEHSDSYTERATSRDSWTSDSSIYVRGASKSGRELKQVQFYGNPVPTSLSRLLFSEHDANDFRNTSIECQDAIVHPEMLDQSRKSEVDGWREYGVYQEVKRADVINKG